MTRDLEAENKRLRVALKRLLQIAINSSLRATYATSIANAEKALATPPETPAEAGETTTTVGKLCELLAEACLNVRIDPSAFIASARAAIPTAPPPAPDAKRERLTLFEAARQMPSSVLVSATPPPAPEQPPACARCEEWEMHSAYVATVSPGTPFEMRTFYKCRCLKPDCPSNLAALSGNGGGR